MACVRKYHSEFVECFTLLTICIKESLVPVFIFFFVTEYSIVLLKKSSTNALQDNFYINVYLYSKKS